MRWFGRHRLFGAQAALFALVVQFAVAFGHFHAALDHQGARAAVSADLDKRTPAAPDQDSDTTCAICATVHLTGSAQAAAPPALPIQVTYVASKQSFAPDLAPDDPQRFEHRSRGPPQA